MGVIYGSRRPPLPLVTETPRTQFIQIPLWVIRHDRVAKVEGGTILRVYASLLADSSYKSRITRLPIAGIQEETGLGRSVVYRALSVLREIGAIIERPNGTLWLPLDDVLSDSTTVESGAPPSTPADGTSTTVDAASTTVDSSLSYIGGLIESEISSPPAASKRGARLPEPFVLTAEMKIWARETVPEVDIRDQTQRFVDYWRAQPGQRGVKLDWLATWRNWMRSARDRMRPPPSGTGRARQDDAFTRIANEIRGGA